MVYNMPQAKHAKASDERTEHLLRLLEQGGDWQSGETLSALLGISRAAVAKRIAGLRARGHAIQSVSGRGHKLLLKREELNADAVGRTLRTRHIGHGQWRVFAETTSSSDEAIAMALAGAVSGSVAVAERQSRGRGRKGHAWFSAPHALMVSVLLRPAVPAADLAWLTPLGVLAVVEAVETVAGLQPAVKAPNDVLVGRRKVAGVLLETGMRGGEPDWAVLGIGCNVNTPSEEFPPPLRNAVTSLLAESGAAVSRADLLAAVLNRMEFWYELLESGNVRSLREEWDRRLAGKR